MAHSQPATNLGDDLGDLHHAPQQVDPAAAQAGQLPDAQAIVGADQDEGAVAQADGVGQAGDLDRGQKPHLLSLNLGQRHPLAW